MKRKHGFFFGFAVLLIAAMFSVAGCDNGNGDNGNGDNGNSGSNELIGTSWQYREGSYYMTMIFTDASHVTCTYSDGEPSDTGTYTVSGNRLTLSLYGEQRSGTITGNTIQLGGLVLIKI
jgi:hypothetical protein